MKVYVNGKLYDAEREKIAIVLTAQDRLNIIAMPPEAKIYAAMPDSTTGDEIKEFQDEFSRILHPVSEKDSSDVKESLDPDDSLAVS